MKKPRIFISGVAGLVGQNLCLRLANAGLTDIIGIDKHRANLDVLNAHQPNIKTQLADLAEVGEWSNEVKKADVVIINQAQIGGLDETEFERNNVVATQNILDSIDRDNPPYIVLISSSVVNSLADDFYTRSKTKQENLFLASDLEGVVLRPTLMFGWFDRKHLGWLRRFMNKTPVFPIPGNGKYLRQPLYVGDFCNVIISCIRQKTPADIFDISGQEKLDYIDLIKTIKQATGEKTPIVKIPYSLFYLLIWLASKILKTPPFTIAQLKALIIPEAFPVIDWPKIFDVKATPFSDAVEETFNHPKHGSISLKF